MMCTVAAGFVGRTLATTQSDFLRHGQFQFNGFKFAALVRAVAKGLILGASARTPPIRAWFEIEHVGSFLSNFWVHEISERNGGNNLTIPTKLYAERDFGSIARKKIHLGISDYDVSFSDDGVSRSWI